MNAAAYAVAPLPHARVDRRLTQRYSTEGRLVAEILEWALPVRVRDLSFGGFAIETVSPLPTRTTHRILLTSTDDWTTTVRAIAVHTRPSCDVQGRPVFVTGFSFIDEPGRDMDAIVRHLLEKVLQVSVFAN